jgi:hypothetical protein
LLVSVTCTDCAGTWQVDDQTLPAAIERGEIITKTEDNPGWSFTKWFGVCAVCQAIFKAAARKSSPRPSVEQEGQDIQQRIAVIRERRPDLTLEQAAHAAVIEHNEAEQLPPAFKRWLIEHER